MVEFADKVVVLAGVGGRCGQRLVERFAAAGATLALCGREAPVSRRWLGRARRQTALCQTIRPGDCGRLREFVDAVLARYGAIDVLVTGDEAAAPGGEAGAAGAWSNAADSLLRGCFYTCQYVAKRWLAQGRSGAIVNTACLAAARPAAPCRAANGSDPHRPADGAGLGLGPHSLAREYEPCGIRVNAVDSGHGKPDSPDPTAGSDDFVRGVLFLASDAAAWITGQVFFRHSGWLLP
ncbi:MAG: SDR family oxidoreductase [Planctomycetes bacterium]|nr:SDR family oxidoreductase [Planctomycetota bacterium]